MTPSEIAEALQKIAQLKNRVYLSILDERWAQAKAKAKEAKRLEDQINAAVAETAKFRSAS